MSVRALPTAEEREVVPLLREARKRRQHSCSHQQLIVDSEAEQVTCEACDRTIGPFLALEILCSDFDHQRWAVDELRKKRDRLRDEVKDLERRERNAKARVRRAEATAG